MTALVLRLAGPLQSWGTSSRFNRRATDRAPSKSGIIGLLAAAQGRRRTDPLEGLLQLKLAVRIDQPGRLERDFQTATKRGESTPISVSTRHYLADAVFLAAVEGDADLLAGLLDAVRNPYFPLYLGRRSCPPCGEIGIGLRNGTAIEALSEEPWAAAPWYQRRHEAPTVELELIADCDPGDPGAELVRDEPVSFDPEHRRWEWRSVRRYGPVTVANAYYEAREHRYDARDDSHDPLGVL